LECQGHLPQPHLDLVQQVVLVAVEQVVEHP
jgi:hypothetical protein